MRRVYRLEDSEGRGVYAATTEAYVVKSVSPTPDNDVRLAPEWKKIPVWDRDDWFFGFEDVASLQRWFYETADRRLIHRRGIMCNVYLVPEHHVHLGTAQVIFQQDFAVLERTLAPEDWIEEV